MEANTGDTETRSVEPLLVHRRTQCTMILGLFACVWLAVSCGGQTDPASTEALRARLQDLDARLAETEKTVEALAKQVMDRDRRLATGDKGSGSAPASPAESPRLHSAPTAAPVGPVSDRNAAMEAIDDEFRQRLARVREQYGDAAGSPERQEALNELYRWYHERTATLAPSPTGDTRWQRPPVGRSP